MIFHDDQRTVDIKMRCFQASLWCGPGWPRYPHRSDAETENQESVNQASKN